MRTTWNEEEDDALQGLPLRAQVIYLRGIRRYMDYASRVSGGPQRRISLAMLAETTQELVNRQIQPKASKDCIRASLEQLKRAGLLERLADPDYLVFLLPKANADKSAQINHPTSPPQLPAAKHAQNAALSGQGLPPQQPASAPATDRPDRPTHQVSVFPEEKALPNGRAVPESAKHGQSSDATPKTGSLRQPPPYQGIVALYHECLPQLPAVYKLNDGRRRRMKALWDDELEDLNSWRNYFLHITRSDFLMGRCPGRDGAPFLASFDFIIHPAKFIKIAEEQYHGKKIQKRTN
jgi:hypothetical protein